MITAKINPLVADEVARFLDMQATLPERRNAAAWQAVIDALYAIANDTDAIVGDDETEAVLSPIPSAR